MKKLLVFIAFASSLVTAQDNGIVIDVDWPEPEGIFNLQISERFSSEQRNKILRAGKILSERIHIENMGNILEQVKDASAYHLEPRAKKILNMKDCMPEELLQSMRDEGISQDDFVIFAQWVMLAHPVFSYITHGHKGYLTKIYYDYERPTEEGLMVGNVDPGWSYEFGISCEGSSIGKKQRDGFFQLRLNAYAVDTESEEKIAATIIHEILHLLGHNHPSERAPGDENLQIYAFSNAIELLHDLEKCMEKPGGGHRSY